MHPCLDDPTHVNVKVCDLGEQEAVFDEDGKWAADHIPPRRPLASF